VTSAQPSSLARCTYCGREFDGRKFQVVLAGRGSFDSAECALLAAEGRPKREPEARVRTGVEKHV
jgi:hypothetical protein